MTVSSVYTPVRLDGNGSVVAFAFGFKINDASELKVYLVDDATNTKVLQTITTDYTLVINTTTEGGTVTFVTAPTKPSELISLSRSSS